MGSERTKTFSEHLCVTMYYQKKRYKSCTFSKGTHLYLISSTLISVQNFPVLLGLYM